MSTIKSFEIAIFRAVIYPYYTYTDGLRETIMFRQHKVLRLLFLHGQSRDRLGGRKRIPIDFLKSKTKIT